MLFIFITCFSACWTCLILAVSSKKVNPTESLTVSSPPTNPIHCGICPEDNKELIGGRAQFWREHSTTEFSQQRCQGILSIIHCHIIITTGRRCFQMEGVKPIRRKTGKHFRIQFYTTKNYLYYLLIYLALMSLLLSLSLSIVSI